MPNPREDGTVVAQSEHTKTTPELRIISTQKCILYRGIQLPDITQTRAAFSTLAEILSPNNEAQHRDNIDFARKFSEQAFEQSRFSTKPSITIFTEKNAAGTSFVNTGIDIQRLPGTEGYHLSLTDGDGRLNSKLERKLATRLKQPLAHTGVLAAFRLQHAGPEFSIDFSQISDKLESSGIYEGLETKNYEFSKNGLLVPAKPISEDDMINRLTTIWNDVCLGRSQSGVEVYCSISGLQKWKPVWNHDKTQRFGERIPWQRDGSVVTGPVSRKFGEPVTPELIITAVRTGDYESVTYLPVNERSQNFMNGIMHKASKAFPVTPK